MISTYSLISAVIFFNVFLIVIFFLRRNTGFLSGYSITALVFLAVLGLLRLLVPLDNKHAYVIRSYEVLPALKKAFLYAPIASFPWLSLGRLFLLIWLLGIVCSAVKDFAALRAFSAQRDNYVRADSFRVRSIASSLGMEYNICVTPDITVPFVAGLFRKTIYIPPFDYSDEDLAFILEHETQHIRGCDALIKLLFFLIKDLFWWNPVAHLFQKELDAILELRCDAILTNRMTQVERCGYLECLLLAMKYASDYVPASGIATGFLNCKNDMKQRFEVILSYGKRKSAHARAALYALMLVFFLLSYMVILQPAGFPEPEDDMYEMFVLSPENAHIDEIDGKYYLHISGESVATVELEESELGQPPYNTLNIIEGG